MLSIFRSLGLRPGVDENIQVGFAQLPDADDEMHFQVVRHWLERCDKYDDEIACLDVPQSSGSATPVKRQLPKRLLEVGKRGDPKVYLRETDGIDATERWLALSHQWGPKPHFCTTVETLASHMGGIDLDALPRTFRDAVTVTRALGCPYLWIDSLCIVQGDGGDFQDQAKHMEQVYSGAYCVLAASRAASQHAGFLHPRRKAEYVALRRGDEEPFFICEDINDFNGHVLESGLNRRGWVLQEHALARRTVFFTDHQTYWECGDGVRCETLMRMTNKRAAFLGDPNFPQLLAPAPQGEKILRYQDLYRRYSRLGLTNASDRPTAIGGLQDRILGALRTRGGFGVFDEGDSRRGLLRRSLLWHRAVGEEARLRRIEFAPAGAKTSPPPPPSWSWMARLGAIEYIAPAFGGVAWEPLRSPWSGREGEPSGGDGDVALVGEAREFDTFGEGTEERGRRFLVLDDPTEGGEQPQTLCVVLGRQEGVARRDALCFLLLVSETTAEGGRRLYERVGAGYLPGRCIKWNRSVKVTIH